MGLSTHLPVRHRIQAFSRIPAKNDRQSPKEDPIVVICTVGENRYPLVSVTHSPWSSSPTVTVRWLAAPGYRQLPTVAAPESRAVRPLCLVS